MSDELTADEDGEAKMSLTTQKANTAISLAGVCSLLFLVCGYLISDWMSTIRADMRSTQSQLESHRAILEARGEIISELKTQNHEIFRRLDSIDQSLIFMTRQERPKK